MMGAAEQTDYTALSDRMTALLGLRLTIAAFIVAWSLARPEILGVSAIIVVLGSLLSYFVEKRLGIVGADEKTREHAHRPGTLFSAGLITGEALTGILIAIPIVVSGRADVLALPDSLHFGQLVGLAVLCVVGYLLYRSGAKPKM